jgi:proteasome lid subunit RPN8/RPN11
VTVAQRSDVRLRFSESAIEALIDACRRAAPFETGGLLLGVQTSDGLWVTHAVEIPVEPRSRRRFVIPHGSTTPIVDRFRALDPRLGYIGDWHSHPANVGASSLDLRTLAKLAIGSFQQRRLMAVARLDAGRWVLDLWAQGGIRLPARRDYELTGPLASMGRGPIGRGDQRE